MAIIRKGKLKGKSFKIHQWCNDWFMLENGQIVSPTNIILTPTEAVMVLKHKNNGFLLNLFELRPDGTFKRKKFDSDPGGDTAS